MTRRTPFLLNTRFETLTEDQIVARLSGFLLNLQIARSGCDPEDEDALCDLELDGLSIRDFGRVKQRARHFLKTRKQRSGLGHLRDGDLEVLRGCRNGVDLLGPDTVHRMDEVAAALIREMPWMAPAIEPIWLDARARIAQGHAYGHRPILLVGPPGVGKTHMLSRLAELAGTPFTGIDVTASTEGFSLAGVARGWGSAMPGRPVSTILETRCGNPTIFVDEIDKSGIVQSTNGTVTSARNALLGLLEERSASRWLCPFYQIVFDMSHVNWVLAANTTRTIPVPLLSRCHVVHLDPMTRADMLEFAARRLEGDLLADVERLLTIIPDGHVKLNMRTLQRIMENVAAIHDRPLLQ
jgi:hypothetical protein